LIDSIALIVKVKQIRLFFDISLSFANVKKFYVHGMIIAFFLRLQNMGLEVLDLFGI
jgi:hypothetical protein